MQSVRITNVSNLVLHQLYLYFPSFACSVSLCLSFVALSFWSVIRLPHDCGLIDARLQSAAPSIYLHDSSRSQQVPASVDIVCFLRNGWSLKAGLANLRNSNSLLCCTTLADCGRTKADLFFGSVGSPGV